MGPIRPITDLGFKGRCAICGFPLTRGFPDGYPNGWKFCCNCLYIAKMLARGDELNENVWGIYRVRKIRRKINLVRK